MVWTSQTQTCSTVACYLGMPRAPPPLKHSLPGQHHGSMHVRVAQHTRTTAVAGVPSNTAVAGVPSNTAVAGVPSNSWAFNPRALNP
eukprot:357016-Chlamydomonas_euryale.AAC.5